MYGHNSCLDNLTAVIIAIHVIALEPLKRLALFSFTYTSTPGNPGKLATSDKRFKNTVHITSIHNQSKQ